LHGSYNCYSKVTEVDTYFKEDFEKIFVAPMWLYSRIAVTHDSKRLREICENSKALCKR
jgi:hypothetical protein